jgi:hypothetical protein
MGYSARKATSGPIRPVRGGTQLPSDPHDAIELEVLGLWLGLARPGRCETAQNQFGKGFEP